MALFNMGGKSAKQKFKRTYVSSDFGVTANVDVPAGKWTVIGSLTVPAQQEITFGANDPTGGSSIAGAPAYLKVVSTANAQLNGKIRFAITNANETNTVVVLEESTQRLSADTSDRTKAVLIPEYPVRAKEDSKLQILMYSASAVTIDYDGTDLAFSIPVTVYQ